MKQKHTPGSWKAQGNYIFAGCPGPHICRLYDLPREPGESRALEQGANARLIAAAPEMLEALKNQLRLLRAIQDDTGYVTLVTQMHLEALITKAEGES